MKTYKLIIFLVLVSNGVRAQSNLGLYFNLNFPMVDAVPDMVGSNSYAYGAFFQHPFSKYHSNNFINRLDHTSELGFNFVGFRDKQTDLRYNNYYIESAFNINFIPDRMTDALRLFVGIRPSFLVYQDNESFQTGSYQTVEKEPRNRYKQGDLDVGISAGLSLSLGQIVRFETKYTWGSTALLSPGYIRGKPSLLEFGLKVSAIDIKKVMFNKDENLNQLLKKYSHSTLLVMLETPNQKLIDKLKAAGNNEQLNHMLVYQNATNKAVEEGFKKLYKFSNIAFFYDSNAYLITNGKIKEAISYCPFNQIELTDNDTSIYIAAFCDDFSPISQKIDYGLYFYDSKFVLLGKPFNIPANHMGVYPNGDPFSYFKRLSVLRNATDFNRIIFKTDARLKRYLVQ